MVTSHYNGVSVFKLKFVFKTVLQSTQSTIYCLKCTNCNRIYRKCLSNIYCVSCTSYYNVTDCIIFHHGLICLYLQLPEKCRQEKKKIKKIYQTNAQFHCITNSLLCDFGHKLWSSCFYISVCTKRFIVLPKRNISQ